jgi:3'-phosphoadenosine 5'-phosphosulfate sulfotransferase (PAPS reductase)/FAD synthetase
MEELIKKHLPLIKKQSRPKLLISFSGGKTSAMMTKLLLEHLKDKVDMKVVFANTGLEHEETLIFVKRNQEIFNYECVWVEAIVNPVWGRGVSAKIVDFETASRGGEPFEQVNAKYGLSNINNPKCSQELKSRTIKAYLRSIGWRDYYTAIGIREDEVDRVSAKRIKKRLVYPLIQFFPSTKEDVNGFWKQQSFNLRLREHEGNCVGCWKKSFRKLATLAKEDPKHFEWWREQEIKYGHFIPEKKDKEGIKLPITNYRGGKSVRDIIEISKGPFNMYVDPNYIDLELDASNGCEESCEAF